MRGVGWSCIHMAVVVQERGLLDCGDEGCFCGVILE
jgi:hypothetical protein